jgi:6-phosphogluconolactonase
MHWILGDERFVPQDHVDSNCRMVRETLLAAPSSASTHLYPVITAAQTPAGAATAYEATLQQLYGAQRINPAIPLFAITILGLGEDGHTASLFPGTAALDERNHWVVAVEGVKPEPRITLTYPALEASSHVMFLVSGKAKREMLAQVWQGGGVPAARLRPTGELHWFIDRAADPRVM